MKPTSTLTKTKRTAKGDRLNWVPLKAAGSVSLKKDAGTGRWLSDADLKKAAHNQNGTTDYLVP